MKRDRRPFHALAIDRRGVLALALRLDPRRPRGGRRSRRPGHQTAAAAVRQFEDRPGQPARGPSKDHATKWVYERAGLPVEITAEFEIWRKVRDSEGVEGWVLHSLLSGRRTALVTPNKKGETSKLYARASASADLAATLQSGVIVNIRNCDGAWCLVDGDGFKGYIEQEKFWGVYPDEKIQ